MKLSHRPAAATATIAVLGAMVAIATPSSAASAWPGKPAHFRLAGTTPSSIAVTGSRVANVTGYRLYASTVKADVFYDNLRARSIRRHVVTSKTPTVRSGGWAYTTSPIYYRYATVHGSNIQVADIAQTNLRSATPTGVRVNASARGTWLTWNNQNASGFIVSVSSDTKGRVNRHDYAIGNRTAQFTPPGLSQGHQYYFWVRSANGSSRSAYSAMASARPVTSQQPLRIMSYNILNLGADGSRATGETVAPWSQRRGPAAALIKSANPDVVGVQEGNWWADSTRHTLQIDSLESALGSTYALAHTEPRYGERDWQWFRTGNYILYKPSAYAVVGNGGYWNLGGNAHAVYQQLRNVTTGAKVFVVNTHLTQTGGHANDILRGTQTQTMIRYASEAGPRLGAAVVYVGDYNSNDNAKQYSVDGPGVAMRQARVADARAVAPATVNSHWDSANDYMRAPFRYDLYIDYVMAAPGVATTRIGMALRMLHGKFIGVLPSDHNPVYADISVSYVR